MKKITVSPGPDEKLALIADGKYVATGFTSVFAAKKFVKLHCDRKISFDYDEERVESFTHVTDEELLTLQKVRGGDAAVPLH